MIAGTTTASPSDRKIYLRIIVILHLDGRKSFRMIFLREGYFADENAVFQLTMELQRNCTKSEGGQVGHISENQGEIRTKKTAAAVLYLSPTRSKSVDIPATLALPERRRKTHGSM